jgi:raffinose/stachyose/melibiose transport system permease protein
MPRSPGSPPLLLIYGLLALPLGFLMVFNYVPAVSALYHAFTSWDVGAESTWTGLQNFRDLFKDPVFLKSLQNLGRLGIFVIVVNLAFPFMVAEMIFHLRSERWRYACRVALVVPMVVPGVVVFMIWKYIYSDAGIVTEGLILLGLNDWIRGWLSQPATALWAVAFVGFPFAYGVNVLIYYAGLANIPGDLLEAAEVDGLGKMGRILHIHIPLVLQQFKLLLIMTVIGVVNGFEGIFILTEDGGPGYETLVPGLYMYQNGFTYQRMGYACAIGLLMLIFLLLFTVTLNRFLHTEKYQPGGRA